MRTLSSATLLLLVSLFAAPAGAQSPQQTVTLTADAPVFLSPDANLTPLRVGKQGSVLHLLDMTADWVHVEYEDPQSGRRVGYVQARFVRINPAEPVAGQRTNFGNGATAATGPLSRERHGFTILVNLGLGYQKDECCHDSATGLAGANLGIGGFVTDKLAIMGRFSGTNVNYRGYGQVSGVVGGTAQYWVSDRFAIEGGGGVGFWSFNGTSSDPAFGLIVGASTAVFQHGGHNLLVGAEYAPAFTAGGTVHNLGITFGYQFHK